jgi:hypothetical protein
MVQYFPVVTGSLTVTGSINVSGGITASGGISISGSIASASFASTASFVALAQSASNAVAAQTASFANAFTVAGNLTAQTLVVQTITSSVDFVTGSTRFGSIVGNTHQFTGSVGISGSLSGTSATFSTEVTSAGSQGRFGGWAIGDGYQGNALEVGVSGGTATLLGYNRTTGVYIPLLLGGNTNQTTTIGGNTIVLQNNGVTALTIASTGAATFASSIAVGGAGMGLTGINLPNQNYLAWYVSGGSGAQNVAIRGNGNSLELSSGGGIALTLNSTQGASFTNTVSINSASGLSGAQGFLFFNNSPTNANSRNWKVSTDQADWGDFNIQYSSTQTGATSNTALSITRAGNVLLGTTSDASFNFVGSTNGHSFLGNTMQLSAGDYGGTERQGAFGVTEWANQTSAVINLASVFPRITFSSRALSVLVQIGTANNSTSHCSALVLFSRTSNGGWSSSIISNINNGGTTLNSASGSGTSITLNFNNATFGSAMITILNRA